MKQDLRERAVSGRKPSRRAVASLWGLAVALVSLVASGVCAEAAVRNWSQTDILGERGPARRELREPVAVAVLDDGSVAALDRDGGAVVLFDDRGRFLRTLGGGRGVGELGLRRPEGLGVDEKGRLWVVDSGNHRLVVIDAEGAKVAVHGSLGSSRDRFHSPRDVAFGGGRAYVADTGNERIQVLRAANGALLDSWSSRTGGRKGYLRKPIAVAYTDRQGGGLWVLNEEAGRRLEFFDLEGKWERSLDVPDAVPGDVELVDVVLEPGLYRMFLADAAGGRVVVLNRRGELQEVVEPDDGVLSPRGVAVNRRLDIYAADFSGRRVLHFSTR